MGENGKMDDMEKARLFARVDELNAIALADNLADLRLHFEERLGILENKVQTLEGLVQNQSQVIGEALGRLMGSGSTESGA